MVAISKVLPMVPLGFSGNTIRSRGTENTQEYSKPNKVYTKVLQETPNSLAAKSRILTNTKQYSRSSYTSDSRKVYSNSQNMKVLLKNQKLEDISCDVLIVNLFEGTKTLSGGTSAVNDALNGLIKQVIKEEDFKGKVGSTLVIRTNGEIGAKKVIVVGLGEKDKFDLDAIRKASASAIRCAKREKAKTVCTILHGGGAGKIDPKEAAQVITEVSQLALYEFDKYKSKDKDEKGNNVQTLIIAETDKTKLKDIEEGIKRGNIVTRGQKLARDLVTEPAMVGNPTYLAKVARQVAKENNLEIKVLDKEDCRKLGMNAFLAVNLGSEEPPKFIVMKYTPKGKPKKHVGIVGKGICFDSGGLSIKPAQAMETMKDDKSGAAAVIGLMSVMKELKPDVEVTGIIAATDNMTGGKAYKPGDIVKAMNGQSIEVLNTDAEGRVTLADATSYAIMKENVDELIDLATLTGACVVALGDTANGVMTDQTKPNHQKLAQNIIKAGNEAGERMWQLPIYDEDREKIKSPVADMINTGSKGKSGAQNGFVFIEKHVIAACKKKDKEVIPYVHIDIAGPSWTDNDTDYGPKGPTGVGVRTLINYLTKYT